MAGAALQPDKMSVPKRFCTLIHTFPQPGRHFLIDAKNRFRYLPLQIEPKSLETLRLTLTSAAA